MAFGFASPPAAAEPAHGRGADRRAGPPAGAWYPVAFTRDMTPGRTLNRRVLGQQVRITQHGDGDYRIAAASGDWAVRRHLGLVWGCSQPDLDPLPELVADDGLDDRHIIARTRCVVRTDYDQAVLGLVDPAHVPMVHNAWWWRSSKRRRLKTKDYQPSPYGFTARSCDRFTSAPLYKLFGGEVDVSIEFRLPSVRVERTQGENGRILNLTTVTPIGFRGAVLRNVLYADIPALKFASPLLSVLGQTFLGQDADILRKFHPSVIGDHPRLFVGDPDRPSMWYFAAKSALQKAQSDSAPFRNPVRSTQLNWYT